MDWKRSHIDREGAAGKSQPEKRNAPITHANPASWHPALRNKSDDVLRALGQSGAGAGLSDNN